MTPINLRKPKISVCIGISGAHLAQDETIRLDDCRRSEIRPKFREAVACDRDGLRRIRGNGFDPLQRERIFLAYCSKKPSIRSRPIFRPTNWRRCDGNPISIRSALIVPAIGWPPRSRLKS